MKALISNRILTFSTLVLFWCVTTLADIPHSRGKVVLVVDKTMAADPQVGPRIDRLIGDLTGDGWRVLRHDVERGPDTPYNMPKSVDDVWAMQNGARVREIRATIKADYDAAPTEVKAVLLIGRVPIPYSGRVGG